MTVTYICAFSANSNANKLKWKFNYNYNNNNNSIISSDARAAESYNFSHIITARNAKWVCIDFVLSPPHPPPPKFMFCISCNVTIRISEHHHWFILFANYKGFWPKVYYAHGYWGWKYEVHHCLWQQYTFSVRYR